MLLKKKATYYIKLSRNHCHVKYPGKYTKVYLQDIGDEKIVVGGRIGSYAHFEEKLKEGLGTLGFKTSLRLRNKCLVTLPLISTPSDKKSLLESFGRLGFGEIFLVYEHLALAMEWKAIGKVGGHCTIIQLEEDRLEMSQIKDKQITNEYSLVLGQSLLSENKQDIIKTFLEVSIKWGLSIISLADDATIILAVEDSYFATVLQPACERLGYSILPASSYIEDTLAGLERIDQLSS